MQNWDLQFCELYPEMFCEEHVKFRNILVVHLVSIVVQSQQSSKNAMLN